MFKTVHTHIMHPLPVHAQATPVPPPLTQSTFAIYAGALLTADNSDDDLIKFEGVPEGYKVVLPS